MAGNHDDRNAPVSAVRKEVLDDRLANRPRRVAERREMQRDAKSKDKHGVQKWEPFQSRVERLCSFLLNSLGEQTIDLDGIIVLAQTFSKTLSLACADLGEDGLGKVRAQYVRATFENIERDAKNAKHSLSAEPLLS